MAQRSDAPLIKHLTQTYGPETARDWQRPPLVLLPSMGFSEYMRCSLTDLLERAGDPLPAPWADVVVDTQAELASTAVWQDGPGDDPAWMNSLRGWMRVRVLSESNRQSIAQYSVWCDRNIGDFDQGADWILFEMWVQTRGTSLIDHAFTGLVCRFREGRDMATILRVVPPEDLSIPQRDWLNDADAPRDRALYPVPCRDSRCSLCVGQKDTYAGCVSTGGLLALGLLAYLGQCSEYLTKVTPTPKPLPKNQQKVHQAKPWLNESLPHYILLDPTRAAEYGHPSGIQAPVGHHASPHPHTRRGHWAALKHDKFARNDDGSIKRVWRKQAWVGATEWTDTSNQMYRVVLPKEATVAS